MKEEERGKTKSTGDAECDKPSITETILRRIAVALGVLLRPVLSKWPLTVACIQCYKEEMEKWTK